MEVNYLADGIAEYRTVEGDLVDSIAFRFYGTHERTTEMIYADNPAIVALPLVLPAGLKLRLRPLVKAANPPPQIELWT